MGKREKEMERVMEEDFVLAGSNLAADQEPVLKPH